MKLQKIHHLMGRGKRGCAEARAAAVGAERDGLHRIKSCRRWGGARGAQRRSKSKKARSCGCRRRLRRASLCGCRVRSDTLFFLQNGTKCLLCLFLLSTLVATIVDPALGVPSLLYYSFSVSSVSASRFRLLRGEGGEEEEEEEEEEGKQCANSL